MARRNALSPWPAPPPAPQTCALCGRETPELTVHHLVPVLAGKRQGIKPQDLPQAQLCPACHQFLHRTFSIRELATEYASLEALRQNAQVGKFLGWLRKQPPSKRVRSRQRK